MLNPKLQDEFLGSQMPWTPIALQQPNNTGAAQRDELYPSITCLTIDVQAALRAVSRACSRCLVVLY